MRQRAICATTKNEARFHPAINKIITSRDVFESEYVQYKHKTTSELTIDLCCKNVFRSKAD